MPSLRRFARLTLVVLLLSALCTAARAETKAYDFEVGGMYSFVRFDGSTSLTYRFAPSLLFGYNFTRRHGLEAIGTVGRSTPDGGNSYVTDFSIFRVGYTANIYPREKITSLFRMGVGRWATDPTRERDAIKAHAENEQHFFFYMGGGVRFHIKEWLAIRLDGSLDVINRSGGLGKSDTQAVGDFGVVFFLGEKQPPAEPAEEPPAEEPKSDEKQPEAGETKPPSP